MTGASEAVIVPTPWTGKAFDACGRELPWIVLYLGSSFSQMMHLRKELPSAWTLLPTGDLLNAAIARMRHDLINLDDVVLGSRSDRSWWDATHLAERNPLASTFLLNVARLFVLRDTLSRHPRCLILSDDRGFCGLLYFEAKRGGFVTGWEAPARRRSSFETLRSAATALSLVLRGIRGRIRGLVELLLRKRMLRALRRVQPLRWNDLRQADVLFVSWARVETFPADKPTPSDAYLPRFAEVAQGCGLRVGYLVRALPGLQQYRAMAQAALAHAVPVILLEELVPVGWMIAAAISSLLLPLRVPRAFLAGQDIEALLRFEAMRELDCVDVIFAWSHLAAVNSLVSSGVMPGIIVAPYEHQPWEKMLRLGLRQCLPKTQMIGVQHSPFAHDYLSLFPSRRETRADMIPDRLLVTGKGYAGWFADEGFPADRLTVIGAPRYEGARAAIHAKGEAILCCSGIQLEESIELATKAVLASRGLGHPLIINYHPVTDESFRQSLRDNVSRLAAGDLSDVRFIDAPVGQLLDDARVVLHSTSAAAFDALFAGKRTIYVRREVALDQNKVPENCTVICRSVEDLRRAIVEAFKAEGSCLANRKIGIDLETWLAPVSVPVIQAVLRGGRRANGIGI
jgi:hypothetical protein